MPFVPVRKSARVLFYATAVSTPEPDALYPLADWLRANGVSFAMTSQVCEDGKGGVH